MNENASSSNPQTQPSPSSSPPPPPKQPHITFEDKISTATTAPASQALVAQIYPETVQIADIDDPLQLLDRRKTSQELVLVRKRHRGKKGKKIEQHYKDQNELIDELLKPPGFVDEAEEANLVRVKIAMYGSVIANIVLLALQLYAAISTSSLSIFATMADAVMDLASNIVLIYTSKAAEDHSPHAYPVGKRRMETAGILVFACIMSALSVELLIEAIRTLASSASSVSFEIPSIVAISIAIATKLCLFLYCQALAKYPSAKILAQDHRNDVFLNVFGITLSLLGALVAKWVDPVGAIIIALLIFRSWASTCYEQVQLIVGKSADPKFLQKITYIALTHDPRILQVDTIRAYHSGESFFVEVDIVLPEEMTLKEAHDIGEDLQTKLETISNVDRCFVHLDYEFDHAPEHAPKKSIPKSTSQQTQLSSMAKN